MLQRPFTCALALSMLLTAAACTNPHEARLSSQRQALSSELQGADSARELASQAVAAQSRKVQAVEEEQSALRAELAAHKRAVEAFLMDHKMAVAALVAGVAGGTAALDDSGAFTEEARQIGALAGFVAAGWALFNMDEVMHVASELAGAEAKERALSARLQELDATLAAENSRLEQAQAALSQTDQRAAGLRAELQAL